MTQKKITSSPNFLIRFATHKDITTIRSLNQKWTLSNELSDKKNGFLSGATYSIKDLLQIISANESVVAIYEGRIIGYTINDNCSSILGKNEKGIANLVNLGLLSPHLRVSKKTQAVMEKEYQRMGIPTLMLATLTPTLKAKYDLLFSRVRSDNPKKIAHEKVGWKFIHQDEQYSYCLFDLHNVLETNSFSSNHKNHTR